MGNPASRERNIPSATAIAALFASVLLTLTVAPAARAADDILANPECCSFAAGPFTQALGETPNMVIPADSNAPHNVVSTEQGPDGMPLFAAPTNLAGTTTPVAGAEYLEAGTYPFHFTLHAPTMSGELVVDGSSGSAVPRPKVKAAFPARKLKAIRKKGVLLRLKGVTEVPSTSVQLRLAGKGLVGEKLDVRLAAGQTRFVSFRLTKKLKKAIRKRRAVKFKATVTVNFGSPAAAARRFR